MKLPLLLVVTACLSAGTGFAQSNDDYRTFTELKGHTIRARILEYDKNRDLLWLENEDQKRAWVGTSLFCEADHAYLKQWLESYTAISEQSVLISIKPQMGPLVNAGSNRKKQYKQKKYYNIINITKRSNIPIKGFHIEYRYFVLEDETGTEDDKQKQYGGELPFAHMTNGQTATFSTPPIDLVIEFDLDPAHTPFGTVYNPILAKKDRVLGVWMKVRGSSPNGVPIVRDICIPENLYKQVKWNKTAIELPPVSRENAQTTHALTGAKTRS